MTEKHATPPHRPAPPSTRYRLWLASAIMLALGTITLSAVVIIIANARDRDREEEFVLTLTAVWNTVTSDQATPGITPTPAPVVRQGDFAFAPDGNQPVYSAGDSCAEQVITGHILDQDNQPTDAFDIRIWGDYTRVRSLFSGEIAGQEPGQWVLELPEAVNRRLWVQIIAGDRLFSAPVEVVFNADDCTRNHAALTFVQIAPLR